MNERKIKTVVFDLDGCIADVGHRLHHVEGIDAEWDDFFAEQHKDDVYEWCKDMVNIYSIDREIIIVTARPDRYKKETEQWLKANRITYDKLFMRSNGDRRSHWRVKSDIYDKHLKDIDIEFCIEDTQECVEMWKSKGLVCLHVNT